MRHEWQDAPPLGSTYAVTEQSPGVIWKGPDGQFYPATNNLAISREILRLAELVRELEAADDKLDAMIHALADALVDRDRLLKGVRDRLGLGEPADEEFSVVRDQTFAQMERRIAALEEENRDFTIRDSGWMAFCSALEQDLGLDPNTYHLSQADEIRAAIRGLEARARAAEEENRRLREALVGITFRRGSAIYNGFKEDADLSEFFPILLEVVPP